MTQTIVIENRTRRLLGVKPFGFNLVPGENDVPKDGWERFQARRECKTWLKKRYIQVRNDIKKATPMLDSIIQFEEDKAIAIVEACTNALHLERWAKKENRNKVQKAIGSRLDFLKTPMGAEGNNS